jgi:hypothetical protein
MSADTEYKRLIDTAKERATFGFLALVQRALQDTDRNMVRLLSEAKSGLDQSALMAVRHFLRQDGNVFLRKIDVLYRGYLERAMQTMYVDIRAGMRKLSAGELSLIDDDVLTFQIEIGRLAQRMRDANEEGIGRLNVIIAQLHGQRDAKERENPFRPYLIARALFEATSETAQDEAKAKLLFEHLADAIVAQLPGFYSSIREVFETSGIRGKFTIQHSRQRHFQRYFGAPAGLANMPPQFGAQIMPGLQWMMQAVQAGGASGFDGNGVDAAPNSVEDLIRRLMAPGLAPVTPAQAKASSLHPIAGQLTQLQKSMARSEGDRVKPRVRDSLDLDKASTMDRMTIEVVSMLFAFMQEDEQISESLRERIGRLQVPMLKAAILDPDLMHRDDHPARQLLNRMSSAAMSIDPASLQGRRLTAEVDRITQRILDDFDTDVSVFSSSLLEFERFLANHLRQSDARISLGIEALEAAEKVSVLMTNLTAVLCDMLVPLNVDKRVLDIIVRVWPHALARATWIDAVKKVPLSDPRSLFLGYRAVLPDLVWSVQEGLGQQGRARLVGMLPELVKRINATLQMIKLPEEECREIMDLLVAIHTQVLRQADGNGDSAIDIDTLRQIFSRITVHWQHVSWELEEPPQPREEVINDVLAKLRIAPQVNFAVNAVSTSAADREFLMQTYLLGTKVDIRKGEESRSAQLMWVSTHRSLYLFRYDDDRSMVIYTHAALLESLREAVIVPVEYAPVFERAVDSLLFGAGKVQAGAAA